MCVDARPTSLLSLVNSSQHSHPVQPGASCCSSLRLRPCLCKTEELTYISTPPLGGLRSHEGIMSGVVPPFQVRAPKGAVTFLSQFNPEVPPVLPCLGPSCSPEPVHGGYEALG